MTWHTGSQDSLKFLRGRSQFDVILLVVIAG